MTFLITVPRFVPQGKYYVFPLGLAYISSYLKSKEYKVVCLNLNHYSEPIEEVLAECIKVHGIDVLCTGGMSTNWKQIEEVVSRSKQIKPDIINVVGGPIMTSEPGLAMANMPIDYGVIGEGEITMAELAHALCKDAITDRIDGIIFYDNNRKLVTTRARDPILDLDSIPMPDYEGLDFAKLLPLMDQYQFSIEYFYSGPPTKVIEIIASRSCPFQCTFCYHPLGQKYRQRSLVNVFYEIDYLVKTFNINIIILDDELFSANVERTIEFANRIKSYGIGWIAQF